MLLQNLTVFLDKKQLIMIVYSKGNSSLIWYEPNVNCPSLHNFEGGVWGAGKRATPRESRPLRWRFHLAAALLGAVPLRRRMDNRQCDRPVASRSVPESALSLGATPVAAASDSRLCRKHVQADVVQVRQESSIFVRYFVLPSLHCTIWHDQHIFGRRSHF